MLKAPKAMQVACVALPEGCLRPYGKDGFEVIAPLPIGSIMFGHGVCLVRNTADYDKVQSCRGTKRPAEEEGSDAEAPADKEQAKAERKARRLLKHLPGVVHALDNTAAPTAAGQLRQLACLLDARTTAMAAAGNEALAARGAALSARLGAVASAAAPKGTGAWSDSIEFDEQAEIDRAEGVKQERLERAQSVYWDQLERAAPAASDDEQVQEAVEAAGDAALKRAVFAALSDDEDDEDAPAATLFRPKTGRQAELAAALEESRRDQEPEDCEDEE